MNVYEIGLFSKSVDENMIWEKGEDIDNFLFLLELGLIKPLKRFSLCSRSDILALNLTLTPMKSYSYLIKYSLF